MTGQTITRGVLSFLIILLLMPLGHAFVIIMEHNLDGNALNVTALILGLLAVVSAFAANRLKNKGLSTALGALTGVVIWGSWVEFIYITYAESVGVTPLIADGEIITKPEFLIMPTALPFAAVTLVMYVFGNSRRWGLVNTLRRWLGIEVHPNSGRYNATGAMIDLVLLVWYTYLILLVCFDPSILGVRHPVTLSIATLCLVISIVLFVRSLKARSWACALSQSIVTVCFLWTFVEVLIKLRFFKEIWIHPADYVFEMVLILIAFAASISFMVYTNRQKK